jgi:hypothetical protein
LALSPVGKWIWLIDEDDRAAVVSELQ